jgi:hypothetical protein
MGKISRRELIFGLGAIITSAGLSHCKGTASSKNGDWNVQSKQWWDKKQKKRESQREKERNAGNRAAVARPYPYLQCGRQQSSRGWLGDQVRTFALNQVGEIAFIIENQGNSPSYFCYAEVYEATPARYEVPFTSFKLTGRVLTSVFPGEMKEVVVPWKATKESGAIVVRCYDPTMDTAVPVYKQYDRKNSGVGWSTWVGSR